MQSTKFRTTLGLLLAATIFVVIGVGVVFGAQRLIADAAWVAHSNEVIGQIDQIEARVRDAEAAQRSYLLTDTPLYLADYTAAVDALPLLQGRLVAMVADNPSQSQHAKALIALITARRAQMAETLERYRVSGLDSARSNIGSESLAVSTAIRREAVEMRARERDLLQQRAASTDNSALVLRALAMLGIPIGLVTILIVYLMLVREIRQRARAESAAANANANLLLGVAQLERGSADLHALSKFGSMLQSCNQPDEAFELTRRMLQALLPATAGTIYRMRNSQDHAEALASWGEHRAGCPDTVEPGTCWALRRGQPHVVASARDATCSHVGSSHGEGVASACIPLSAQGVQLGLLYLTDADASFLERTHIIEAVAEQLSMALSNLYLQERLRLQSIREPLTGLFNRRYLEEASAREFARCGRRGAPASLLMLDIDHFKSFNDVHGHAGGDLVLAEFGKLLQALSRPEDIACRYGGEEFTLIMPETTLEIAQERAEAIRVAVESMRVSHQGTMLPPLTVSIGVASYPDDGRTPEAVLRAADDALYRAKRAGRNRVEVAGMPAKLPQPA
jgi:diguanylate cyclase (GGDEF)-like protein